MKRIFLLCLLAPVILLTACGQGKKPSRTDTMTSGFATIVSDDAFSPIMEEQIFVFEALNKEASIHVLYENEVRAFEMLLKDSVRMIIAARDLTDEERAFITSNNRILRPRSLKIAYDAVTLIVNRENTDSLMSITNLEKIMTGEITSWKQINPESKYDKISVFFDNPNSSTVRYIKDSINRNQPLYDGLRALKSNKEVLEMVSKTPNALGVVGVNWVTIPADSGNVSFINNITVMSVSKFDVATEENSYKPFPAYLSLGKYPLTREVYAILTDLRGTLPAGFTSFLAGDRGQRIILRAGLLPGNRPTRIMSVREEF